MVQPSIQGAGRAPEPPRPYSYLIKPEARFLDAAVSRLIPADELGPGAKESGVTYFIDGQLAGPWGTHSRNYRMGPWREGTPEQGFQSPLVPQEIYRFAIRDTNLHCRKQYGKNFEYLQPAQQDEVLRGLETDAIELPSMASSLFFGMLLTNTIEGFLADPLYGGNRDKAGWKLVGFPGVASGKYNELLDKHDAAYRVEPVSILDIVEEKVAVDAQGYPKHVAITTRK